MPKPAGLDRIQATIMEGRVTMEISNKNWQSTVFDSWETLPESHPASFGSDVTRQDNALPLRDLVRDLCLSRTRIKEIQEPYTDYDGQTGRGISVMRKVTFLLEFKEAKPPADR